MRFVVVPQWQGSPSSRALRLTEGAHAIFGDLPSRSSVLLDVPVGAGASLGTAIHRLSAIAAISRSIDAALDAGDGTALVIGGDCGVELAAIRHALRADTCVVWFDAHPDLHSPESSESGAFSGMVLGALLGRADDELATAGLEAPAVRLVTERVVLAGARTFDPAEDDYVDSASIATVSALDFDPAELVAAVAATGAGSVYLHIDLDVLDPARFDGLLEPQAFGIEPEVLVESITALVSRFELVGAGLCTFAPVSPAAAADDLGTVLRIIGALAR